MKQHEALQPLSARCSAEFIGTFFLMYSLSACATTESIGCALSVGGTLTAMIYALGSVSGGHFNPAVTLAVSLSGRNKILGQDALSYVLAQLAGAIAAVNLNWFMMPVGARGFHVPAPAYDTYNRSHAAGVELIYSMALCYVVLNTATVTYKDESPNAHFGLSIGMTVTSGAIAVGPISGCSLNPALSFGSTLSASWARGYLPIRTWGPYVLAPILGALLAAICFWLVRGGLTERFEYSEGSLPSLPTFSVQATPRETTLLNRNQPVLIPRPAWKEGELVCCLKWAMQAKSKDGNVPTCDLDLTCVKFGRNGDCLGAVYFAKKNDQGIRHLGDHLLDNADPAKRQEQIYLRLPDIKPQVMALVFTVMIYSGEDFDDVSKYSFSLRAAKEGEKEKGPDICRYDRKSVAKQKSNAQMAAMVYRKGDDWYFKAIDECYSVPPNSSYRKLLEHLQAQVVETLGTSLSESARASVLQEGSQRLTPRALLRGDV